MLDSSDFNAGDSTGPTGPTGPSDGQPQGRDGSPNGPSPGSPRPGAAGWGITITAGSGPGQRDSAGRDGSRGTRQQTTGGSSADDNGASIPDADAIGRRMDMLGKYCAMGLMDPAQARASASIFKEMNQIRVQKENIDRAIAAAAAASQRSASNGVGVDEFGEPTDQPSPGAPRMVPARLVDTFIDFAMEYQPQLLQALWPVLDDDQKKRVTEFVNRSLGPGDLDDDRS